MARVRYEQAAAAANTASVQLDEDEDLRWLYRVRETLEQSSAEQLGAAARVFDVPRALRDSKPEAYAPQHFALGPYHHQRRPELRDMERYKLAAAKRAERLFAGGRGVGHLAQRLLELQAELRAPYHRVLELGDETLAWMMAIDTCFLLDFLESYHRGRRDDEAATVVMMSSATNWINATVRDAMMIENQLPLRVLAEAAQLRHAAATTHATLRADLSRFIKHVSPIKMDAGVAVSVDLDKDAHLLELLYHFLVPPDAVFDEDSKDPLLPAPQAQAQDRSIVDYDPEEQLLEVMPEQLGGGVQQPSSQRDEQGNTVTKAISQVSSRLNVENLISRPMRSVTRRLPALPGLVSVVRKLASNVDVNAILSNMNMDGVATTNTPLAKEIKIPSVEQLAKCGVRFVPAPEGIRGIAFDAAAATLHLPVITLDANTEVVLRNLMAYEAVAVRGPLVLSRYTEMMNGIVDTTRDVRILRRSGVLVNRMKSNREAADMWNGMCRAARVSRVSRLDAVVRAVNEHRDRAPAVRLRKMLKRYVFGSWKVLTLLASVVLLVMTGLEAFCSAYPCHDSWFGDMLQLSTDDP
ncbi:unnamed protein product [Urochloa decumbens]|uniref:Uncharacterized protein n=1 Tax=Urochloa decumbens TaxID=240449 RepID=A0ABC9DB33_9POAL